MKFSRESRYALVGLRHLASKPYGTIIGPSTLAAEADLPAPFMAKIFHKLARDGILASHRGRVRGYSLARQAEEITISQVLVAIEGADLYSRCIFVSDTCDDSNPCPLHDRWAPVVEATAAVFDATSVAALDFDLEVGPA